MKLFGQTHDPHLVPRVPRLAGLPWPQVAPYLEEFLKRLLAASDSAHLELETMTGAELDSDSPLARRVPTAHRHQFLEITGLEEPFVPRPPRPHTHGFSDIPGLGSEVDQLHLHKHPHTHLRSDILGTDDTVSDQVGLHKHPHTHRIDEVFGDSTQFVLAGQIFGG